MNEELVNKIIKQLPGFVCKNCINQLWFVEGIDDWLAKMQPPNKRVICEIKGWFRYEEVGEFDIQEDVIIIYPDHYNRLAPLFKMAMKKVGCNIPLINYVTSPSELEYQHRLGELAQKE